MTNTRFFFLIFFSIFLLFSTPIVHGEGNSIATGVTYSKFSLAGNIKVNMVAVKMKEIEDGNLVIEPATGNSGLIWGTGNLSSIASREKAIAAINGPYFAQSGGKTYPLGFMVMDSSLVQLGNLKRPMVGISHDGVFKIEVAHPKAFVTSDEYFEPIWLWGVNQSAGADNVTMYDRRWGNSVSVQGGVGLSVKVERKKKNDPNVIVIDQNANVPGPWDGEVVEIKTSGNISIPESGYVLIFRGARTKDISRYSAGKKVSVYLYDLPKGWESMRWISTLGPWFVHDGRKRDYSDETSYGGSITGRAVRSVIGTTWNDEIFFATVTGSGVTIGECADALIECNAREAVMCDSGGSTGMWVKGAGTIGGSRGIPVAFVVRESDGNTDRPDDLRVYSGKIR